MCVCLLFSVLVYLTCIHGYTDRERERERKNIKLGKEGGRKEQRENIITVYCTKFWFLKKLLRESPGIAASSKLGA